MQGSRFNRFNHAVGPAVCLCVVAFRAHVCVPVIGFVFRGFGLDLMLGFEKTYDALSRTMKWITLRVGVVAL